MCVCMWVWVWVWVWVCVCWPRESVQLGGRWGRGRNGSDRSLSMHHLSVSLLRAPPHTRSFSEFCSMEHSGSPCSTLCLYPIKRRSSSFHLPETCNSHSVLLPKPLAAVHGLFRFEISHHHFKNTLEKRRNKNICSGHYVNWGEWIFLG